MSIGYVKTTSEDFASKSDMRLFFCMCSSVEPRLSAELCANRCLNLALFSQKYILIIFYCMFIELHIELIISFFPFIGSVIYPWE